jgi:hypothetical protein
MMSARLLPSGRRVLVLLWASAAIELVAAPAHGQQTGGALPRGAIVGATLQGGYTYTPADFARFAPATALDMLVLINGPRISGQPNDGVTELGRIPASTVVRIEIRDGATFDIGRRVASIVTTKTSALTGHSERQPEFRVRNVATLISKGSASASGGTGPISYSVGAIATGHGAMPSKPGRVSYAVIGAHFRGTKAVGGSMMYRLNTGSPMALGIGFSYAGNKNNAVRVGLAGEF